MSYEETNFYNMFYLHQDHAVDNIDLIVLQNDHREPVVEVLVALEGNTIQGDMQSAIGTTTPNWDTSRTRYTSDGHLYFYKDQQGNLDTSTRVKCKAGLPKAHLSIYPAIERIHMINAIGQLETNDENQLEARLRILLPGKRYANRRVRLWKERREQLAKHLTEEDDIKQQLDIETALFNDPNQTLRQGRFQGPRFQAAMPPEYKKAMTEAKACHDIRVRERAENFEKDVKNTFAQLEETMKYVRLPTSNGTRYHTGLSVDVFEQTEKPGLATIHTANHQRFMKVLTQLNYHGDYSHEEEIEIDEEELEYVVATELGKDF